MVKSLVLSVKNDSIVNLSKKFFYDLGDIVDLKRCSETFGLKKGYQTSPYIVISDGLGEKFVDKSPTWIHILLIKNKGNSMRYFKKGDELHVKNAKLEISCNNLVISFKKTDKDSRINDIKKYLGGSRNNSIIVSVLKNGFDEKLVNRFIEENPIDDKFTCFYPLEYIYITNNSEKRYSLL